MPRSRARSTTLRPASRRSMTRRRNSGGYPRLPIAASCGGQQHDSSYPTPRKAGHTTSASAVNFLRAVAIHFAEPPNDTHRVEEVGHGRLHPDLRDRFWCGSDAVTVLYEDSIRRGETIGLPIPIPADIRNGNVSLSW